MLHLDRAIGELIVETSNFDYCRSSFYLRKLKARTVR